MNRLVLQVLVVLFYIGSKNLVFAQSCNLKLTGNVKDLHDGSSVIGALITLEGTNFFCQTNLDGYCEIEGVCPGDYVIIVSHPESLSAQKRIKLTTNQNENFQLEYHVDELEEIILSDSKISRLNKSLLQVSLDIGNLSSYGGNTLTEALNIIPGASILKTGTAIAKPIIHGMYGSRVGIVTDDFRQFDQEWGPDHAPFVDFDSFENLQLVKGAAALKYGGDTPGGMIILSSKRKILKDTLFGKTNLNFESNGRGGKWSTLLEKNFSNGYFIKGQFTLKRFGDFNAPNYVLSNTGLVENDFSMYVGRDIVTSGWNLHYSNFNVETGILKGAHIGNVQDLFYALKADEPSVINEFTYNIDPPRQLGKHQKISFKHFTLLNNNTKLEWGYNYQANRRKEFDVRRGGRSEIPAIDLLLRTHSLMGSLSGIKRQNWNFEMGFNGLIQDNYSDPYTGIKRLIPDYIKYEAGIYLLGNYQKNNTFVWEWGLRMDHILLDAKKYYYTSVWEKRGFADRFEAFEIRTIGNQILTNPKLIFQNFSGQTGIATQLGEKLQLNLSYILSQRAPNPSELFSDGLHHSIAAIEYGNLTLQKEVSHKLIMGLSKTSDHFNYTLEPFFSRITDYIYIEPTGLLQSIRGAFPVWSYRSTNVNLAGIDFSSTMSINSLFNLDLGASYTHAQDITNYEPLIMIPPFNSFQKLRYQSKKGYWNVELSNQISLKQNRFPNSNFEFDLLEEGKIVTKTVDISESPNGFHRMDAVFSFQLNPNSKRVQQLRLIFQNITNSTYRDYLNRMRFYADEMGRNIRLQFNYSF